MTSEAMWPPMPVFGGCIMVSRNSLLQREISMTGPRLVRAPRGTQLTCKSWLSEAAYRMIQNNLDPDVAEKPEDLIVYGGRGQAARSWEAFDAILASLKN